MVQEALRRSYISQQIITSKYVGSRKGGWENKMVLEDKQNSKILWNMAREIAGKTKRKDEQMYDYREDMTRHKIEEDWDPFIRDRKIYIYQKKTRISFDLWYGTEDMSLEERKVRENIENMNRGQGNMMPLPIMKEEDLVRIVKKQKK